MEGVIFQFFPEGPSPKPCPHPSTSSRLRLRTTLLNTERHVRPRGDPYSLPLLRVFCFAPTCARVSRPRNTSRGACHAQGTPRGAHAPIHTTCAQLVARAFFFLVLKIDFLQDDELGLACCCSINKA